MGRLNAILIANHAKKTVVRVIICIDSGKPSIIGKRRFDGDRDLIRKTHAGQLENRRSDGDFHLLRHEFIRFDKLCTQQFRVRHPPGPRDEIAKAPRTLEDMGQFFRQDVRARPVPTLKHVLRTQLSDSASQCGSRHAQPRAQIALSGQPAAEADRTGLDQP